MRYIHYIAYFVVILVLLDAAVSRNGKRAGRKNNRRHKKGRDEAKRHSKNITSTAALDTSLNTDLISTEIEANNKNIVLERYKAILQMGPGKISGLLTNRNKTNKWTEAIVEISLNLDDKIQTKNATKEKNNFRLPITKTVGKFGYHSIQDPVSGKVIHIKDKGSEETHFGCFGDMANKDEISPEKPWIALVSRGKCRFLEKIKLAERFGASGVIVYDNDLTGNVEVMSTIGTKITSLMINAFDGKSLAQLINKGQEIYIEISAGKTHVKTPGSSAQGLRAHWVAIAFLTVLVETVGLLVH